MITGSENLGTLMLEFSYRVLVNHRDFTSLVGVPNGGNFFGCSVFRFFEIDVAGGAWNFVGVLVDLGYASALRSTSRHRSTHKTHRVEVPEQLHQFCRSEFVQIKAEYPKAVNSQYRQRDLLTVALSMFVF